MSRVDKPLSKHSRENVECSNIKLHLRQVQIGEHEYRVISPRPGMAVRWATNYHHDTWHIICDTPGWKLLTRLFWGLGYEKHPNTLIWIGADSLQPVPFDQEPSRPIFIVPTTITHINRGDLQRLAHRLSQSPRSSSTIRWRTWGLSGERMHTSNFVPRHIHTDLEAGAITIRADANALCTVAEWLCLQDELGLARSRMTYEYLDDANWPAMSSHSHIEGEVQYYRDFALISRRSANARARIIDGDADIDGDILRAAVHQAAPALT